MNENKIKYIRITVATVFVATEIILSYMVQTTHGDRCQAFMYSSVALCFLVGLGTLLLHRERVGSLVRLGLAVTLVADYFLVLSEPAEELLGVLVFTLTQACYFLALMLSEKRRGVRVANVIARIAVVAVIIPVTYLVLGENADLVSIVSVFYYSNLVCNAVFAFANFKRHAVFAFGLALFAMCDLAIGFNFLAHEYLGAAEGSFLDIITSTGVSLEWVFYVPSQTLIALSLLLKRKE